MINSADRHHDLQLIMHYYIYLQSSRFCKIIYLERFSAAGFLYPAMEDDDIPDAVPIETAQGGSGALHAEDERPGFLFRNSFCAARVVIQQQKKLSDESRRLRSYS